MQFHLLQQIGDLLFIAMSILIAKQLCLFPLFSYMLHFLVEVLIKTDNFLCITT